LLIANVAVPIDPLSHLTFNGLSQHLLRSLPQHLRQQVSFGDWNRSG
jgi:hypothetical protein